MGTGSKDLIYITKRKRNSIQRNNWNFPELTNYMNTDLKFNVNPKQNK